MTLLSCPKLGQDPLSLDIGYGLSGKRCDLGQGGSLQLKKSLKLEVPADNAPSSWDNRSILEEGSGQNITVYLCTATSQHGK